MLLVMGPVNLIGYSEITTSNSWTEIGKNSGGEISGIMVFRHQTGSHSFLFTTCQSLIQKMDDESQSRLAKLTQDPIQLLSMRATMRN